MNLLLEIKSFSFPLLKPLSTSQGVLKKKEGWLLHLKSQSGESGWGEVSPINNKELKASETIIKSLGNSVNRENLEKKLNSFPRALGFGLGAALAEIDSLVNFDPNQPWSEASQSAFLLPTDQSIISELESILSKYSSNSKGLTFKWKVGILPNNHEKKLLDEILTRLPNNARLRLDANAGWDRIQAQDWANYLISEERLEWIEQPLQPNDLEGLNNLSKQIPIALDESLIENPKLRQSWKSWQIRKPLLEGDPRVLLKELNERMAFRVISTSFETGIGKRWIEYLAELQKKGPTPTAPGLAIGWCPNSQLFSNDPQLVWESA